MLTLRFKLFGIVLVASASLIVVTVASASYQDRVTTQIDAIRDGYLPKIRLRPQLQSEFDALSRTIQHAVEANEIDLLEPAKASMTRLQSQIVGATDALSLGQIATLRYAVDDYFATAISVARHMIEGGTDEQALSGVPEMQDKRERTAALIEHSTEFDDSRLAGAFTTVQSMQRSAARVRLAATAGCLIVLLAMSVWMGAGLSRNLSKLIAGLQRFGRRDFSTPIAVTSGDEIATVADQANQMATQIARLDDERARRAWLDTGGSGLLEQLQGDLSPKQVAERSLTYLARYLDVPMGGCYGGPEEGPYVLLAAHGVDQALLATVLTRNDGLVAEAIARTTPTVVEAEVSGMELRSGIVATKPKAIAVLPLVRGDAVLGFLELATLRSFRDVELELLANAGVAIATTLEVARARLAASDLLDRTRRQATEIERSRAHLEQKAEELARASAYKSQFLANMSHELRTPLNAIIGFSELMYDGAIPLDDPAARDCLADILASGRHLLQLINDVLDLSKIEAGKLEFHPEPLSLGMLVAEVLAVLRTATARQRITVTTEIAAEVDRLVLDPARLKQVLYNYLSNAIKFSPTGAVVHLRASVEPGDRVRLEVVDRGPGISAADIARLFNDFQQVAEGAKKSGGTGLGLALTKRLVEAQGGVVGVRSELGAGSTFHAILPLTSTSSAPILPRISVATHDHGPVVLVVEDDPDDRAQLVSTLTSAGYAVDAVSTGGEAVARARDRVYDAITLDLFLPDAPGLEILARLREGPNQNVPVIVVTVVAERGAVAGYAIHDLLSKPLVERDLLSSLERAGVRPSSRVLVVDDDPASLKVMAATLHGLGYRSICEANPKRAMQLAADEPPGAIVLDLLMPEMTGFEFLEKLRASPVLRNIPVIVWTSKDLNRAELDRLRSSAQAVVTKGAEGNTRVVEELAACLPRRSPEGV